MRVAAEAAARDPGSVSAAAARVFPEAAEAEVQAALAVPGAADPAELVLVVLAVEVAPEPMPVICGERRDKLEVVVAAVVEAEEEAELVLAGAWEAEQVFGEAGVTDEAAQVLA